MKPDDVIRIFRESGGLLGGHFLLASGRHSDEFFQAARVTQYVRNTALLCAAIAERFADDRIELVAGPATGGIILAYETARHLNARAVYTEKDEAGMMTLKRGFSLSCRGRDHDRRVRAEVHRPPCRTRCGDCGRIRPHRPERRQGFLRLSLRAARPLRHADLAA